MIKKKIELFQMLQLIERLKREKKKKSSIYPAYFNEENFKNT